MKTFNSVLVLASKPDDQFKIDQALKKSSVTNNIYMAMNGEEAVSLIEDSKNFSRTTKSINPHMLVIIDFSGITEGVDHLLNYLGRLSKENRDLIILSLKGTLENDVEQNFFTGHYLHSDNIGYYQVQKQADFQPTLQTRLSRLIKSLESHFESN